MNTLTVEQLAGRLETLEATKYDAVTQTKNVRVVIGDDGYPKLAGFPAQDDKGLPALVPIKDTAHQQFAAKLEVPIRYYRRMLEGSIGDRSLLADNINHWMHSDSRGRMFRFLDGHLRAIVGPGYRGLDNFDLMGATYPTLKEKEVEWKRSQVTDNYMYLSFAIPGLVAEPIEGDIVQGGLTIRNGEIGQSMFDVHAWIYRCICDNGATLQEFVSRRHIGSRTNVVGDEIKRVLTTQTRALQDAAIWSEVRDSITAAFDEAWFHSRVKEVTEMHEEKVEEDDVEGIVEVCQRRFDLSDGERKGALMSMVRDGDMSRWGLINSITAQAHKQEDYDRAMQLETVGGKIWSMEKTDFEGIVEAAKKAVA